MRADDLRNILLVKAVEERDLDGTLLPATQRLHAARDAKREAGPDAAPERLLARRAHALVATLTQRHPFLDTLLQAGRASVGLTVLVVVLALALGASLSALDGTRRINVLAFPLTGLLAWNLVVYAVLLASAMPRRRAAPASAPGIARWVVEFRLQRLAAAIARARAYDAPLADALGVFAREWASASRTLLAAAAARAMHLGAAAVGIGLVAGLYLRGIVFDYQAGWESTFLDAPAARQWIAVVYGPASALTGIALPGTAELASLRWPAGAGGGSAAQWIHLIAATALLFVILPRLLLAGREWLRLEREARSMPAPEGLDHYARRVFSGAGGLASHRRARVIPYASEPGADARARLRTFLRSELGGEELEVIANAPVPYGGEDAFIEAMRERPIDEDLVVVLADLAATPEDENHGTLMEALRGALARQSPRARVVVVIDESAYRARMGEERLAERRKAWEGFVAARGLESRFAQLSP